MLQRWIIALGSFFIPLLTQAQQEQLLPVKIDHKWGYINRQAQVVIAPVYDHAGDFLDSSHAVTVTGGKAGLIDRKGKVVLQHRYDGLRFLTRGFFAMQKDSLWGITDSSGRIILNCSARHIRPVKRGQFLVKIGEHAGVVDHTGRTIIPARLDQRFSQRFLPGDQK
jgi:hypothetical protein